MKYKIIITIQKAEVKPVQTVDGKDLEGHLSVKFHRYEDGVLVMEYRKPGSKQPYYELVDEIPKEAIPGSENPDDPLLLDIWKGFYDGAGKLSVKRSMVSYHSQNFKIVYRIIVKNTLTNYIEDE